MKKIHYAWWIMIACCAISCCTGIVFISAGNFYRPVAESLGVGVGTFTVYVMISSLTMAALFPVMSKLIGKYPVPVLLIGGILEYAPFGLMSCFNSLYQFYVAGFFIGVGAAITMFMAVPILINMWFVEKKGTAMGISLAFSGVAGAIASLIVGYTIPTFGWRMSYMIMAIIGLCVFVPAILLIVRTPQQKQMEPYGAEKQTVGEPNNVAVENTKELSPTTKTKALLCMMLSAAALSMAASEAPQVAAFSTGHFHLSPALAATMVSLFSIGAIIGKIGLGAIDDRIGHMKAFLLGLVLVVISQVMLLASGLPIAMISFAIILAGMALTVYTVLPPLMTSAIFGPKDYNQYWAYIMSTGGITGAVATPLFGTMFDMTGSYTAVFTLIIILTIVGGILGVGAMKIGMKE